MAIRSWKTKSRGKRYAARVHVGGGKYRLLPVRATRREAKEDEARFQLSRAKPERVKAYTFANRWLSAYREQRKISSAAIADAAIKHWLKEFGSRSLPTITRDEARDWAAATNPKSGKSNRWAVPPVITMLNEALDEGLIERNPFRGLAKKGRGRADKTPLTVAEVEQLADIGFELWGEPMRAFVLFGAYSGMRAGEMFALRWGAVNLARGRVKIKQRFYGSDLDTPKGGRPREITLLPEARSALMGLGRRSDWVFTGRKGNHLTQSALAYYWNPMVAAFGRRVTPHELRHFLGHHMYVTLGYPARVVARQLTHSSPRLVEDVYGHGDVGALEEIERTYVERSNVIPFRKAANGE